MAGCSGRYVTARTDGSFQPYYSDLVRWLVGDRREDRPAVIEEYHVHLTPFVLLFGSLPHQQLLTGKVAVAAARYAPLPVIRR